MEKDSGDSFNNDSSFLNEPGSNKSFVKKVRSRVSGLLPSSLSKWFSNDDTNKPTVRPREEDDDDNYEIQQPPSKKAKLPSLNNTHVNSLSSSFKLNDTTTIHSSPNSKPNNFKNSLLEPIPGPSGVRTRTLFAPSSSAHYGPAENLLNGDKESDSGESTSGYSSMAKFNKQNIVSPENNKKSEDASFSANPSILHSTLFRGSTRSLFSERSLSPQVNSTLNSRRPSFNASTFGSPNFIDRTLSTKRIINSPFYSGRTTYGGAAAYSKSLRSSRESSVNQVQVKPVNQSLANDKVSLSKTARRILDTLEQYGTPVSEAKKIPNPSRKRQHDGLLSQYTGANPYVMREHKAPNKELQIPTVPDLLKMKLKERLQDSTVAVRQIATTSKSSLNLDEYKIKTVEENVPKHTNKIKKKVTAVRQKPENETVEAVKLPNIALPITNLPKFDFTLPTPSTVKPIKSTESKTTELKVLENISKEPETISKAPEITEMSKLPSSPSIKNAENAEFRFSNPLVLAENLVSIIAINDFKFSDPVCKQKLKTDSSVKVPSSPVFIFKPPEAPSTSNLTFNFKPGDSTINLKKKTSNSDLSQPATTLLSGSVDDIFNKSAKTEASSATLDKFKPSPDTWECSVCMIRNLPDKTKCAACEAPKEKPESTKNAPPPIDFGSRFKMSADQWECNACMVRNANIDTKCVACSTPKTTLEKPTNPNSSFGDKFKPPTSTWECPTCMIRNKNELDRCAACETRNPSKKSNNSEDANKKPIGGFGDMFKKKTTEWECTICMVRNPQEKDTCVACQTPKVGASKSETSKSTPVPSFTFGIIPTNKSLNRLNQSKKTESKNMNVASIFGNNKPDAPAPSFTFGIPSKTGTQLKEGKTRENKTEEKLPAPAPTFLFNDSSTKSVEKQEDKPKQPPNSSSLFSFGNKPAKQDDKSENVKKPENESQKPTLSTSAFTFGKPSLKRSATDTESTSTEAKKEALSSASIVFSPPKALPPPAQKDSTLSTQSNKIEGLFGSATPSTTQSAANSSFTFTQTNTATTTQSNLFSFTTKTTASSIFGGNTTTTTTTEAAPVFKFNSPAGEQNNSQPSFNAPSSNIFGGSNTNFSTPSKITFDVPKSSFETPSKPMFQQNTFNKPVFQNPKPIFDTSVSAPAPITTPAPTATAAPAAPAPFGSGNPSSIFGAPEVKPFSFNAQPNDSATKSAGFSFGGPKPEPAKPTFNFGSTAASDSGPPGGFSFPVNNNAASNTFGFGAPKAENPSPFQSSAPATNVFGPPQVPVQPVQNGGFNFGTSTNNVKPGFNFGGAAPTAPFNMQPPAPAPAGVFSFGSSTINQAPQQSAAFNFGATAAAPPTFDVNVKPTFNFTGGATPTFSAQPNAESGAASQRKKIRAVRRTQPR